MALLDLEERRLKDLIRPERIWQVLVDGLPTDFPPLRTLDARPNNLPAQPNVFIGREAQIAAVIALLRRPDVRLLTLIGPGGTGKTRLALQVAAELLDEFADGVWFVDLAPLTDPALVAGSIAGVFSLQESAARSAQEVLHDYLSGKTLLLVLDNFEQVRPAASLVDTLLRRAPHLEVLITSRVPLHLYGEQEHTVPPLALPATLPLPPLERLTQYEAVRLFVERARTVREDFQVTNETAPAVAEICARLDGLPLAIELAAARVRLFAPEALLTRLGARLATLTGGPRNLPARQQTLRATIEWSYNLLSPGEQQLFRRLAVFQGGRTLEAIDAICNGDGTLAVDVLDGVEALIGHSLLGTRPAQDGELRFVMLETIHEYAREILQKCGEAATLRQAHAQYFLRLIEQAERELLGPQHLAWMNRLEDEHDNIRAALRWALDTGAVGVALRLAGALWLFWWTHVHYREGRQWLEAVLA
ncbi:MAG TPA: AAA family ATPase, partial [Chloroflexia bacterium]